MQSSDAGGAPAAVEEFIQAASKPSEVQHIIERNGDGPGDPIQLIEIRDGDPNLIGGAVTLNEAREMAEAVVRHGGRGMPEALLKMALAVIVLSQAEGRTH